MALASLAVVAAVLGAAAAQSLQLTKLPQAFADSYGAKCLDGSPPAYYASVQDPKRWVVFIEGGGWCSDVTAEGTIKNCAGRAMGGGGSSAYDGPTENIGGLLSLSASENPDFWNASLVFVKYCDGTSHSSNATEPIPVPASVRRELEAQMGVAAPTQFWLRGRPNLRAVIAYLLGTAGMANASTVVLSGGSAGATSTFLALDAVRSWLPPSIKVLGAPDAGFFLDQPRYGNSSNLWYRQTFIAADPVWNSTGSGGVNSNCMRAYAPSKEQWRCFLPQYNALFITTPLFISNSELDMWGILNILDLGCVPSTNNASVAGLPTCGASQMAAFNSWRGTFLSLLAPVLAANPSTGAYTLSCFVHEINVDYCSTQPLPNCIGWNTYSVASSPAPGASRVTLQQVFSQWYRAMLADGSGGYERALEERRASVERLVALAQEGGHAAVERALAALAAEKQSLRGAVAQSVSGSSGARVAVIDQENYPNNPSCPFPTPKPMPA